MKKVFRYASVAFSVYWYLAPAPSMADFLSAPVVNQPVELTENLAQCSGRLAVADRFRSYVDGLTTAAVTSRRAMDFMISTTGLPSARYVQLTEQDGLIFDTKLYGNPMDARSVVQREVERCEQFVAAAQLIHDDAAKRAAAKAAAATEAERQAKIRFEADIAIQKADALAKAETARQETLRTEAELAEKAADAAALRHQASLKAEAEAAAIKTAAADRAAAASETRARLRMQAEAELAVKRAEAETNLEKARQITLQASARDASSKGAAPSVVAAGAATSAGSLTRVSSGVAAPSDAVGGQNSAKSHPAPWKVSGIALGDGTKGCSRVKLVPLGELFGEGENAPTKMNVCSTAKSNETLSVAYDASGKNVVYVVRALYVNHFKADVKGIIKNATEFYGKPDFENVGNYSLGYGNSFTVSKNNRIVPGSTGKGLTIEASLCGARLGVDCTGATDATMRVVFTLKDVDAYKAAYEAGKVLVEKDREEATKVSF